MISKSCETCEFRGGHGCAHCRPLAGLPLWYSGRAALEEWDPTAVIHEDGEECRYDRAFVDHGAGI